MSSAADRRRTTARLMELIEGDRPEPPGPTLTWLDDVPEEPYGRRERVPDPHNGGRLPPPGTCGGTFCQSCPHGGCGESCPIVIDRRARERARLGALALSTQPTTPRPGRFRRLLNRLKKKADK